MVAPAAIPIASFGRLEKQVRGLNEGLVPEYDVVHSCVGPAEDAKAELPTVLSGNLSAAPQSGLGSNISHEASERKVPRAVVVGDGIPKEEYEGLVAFVQERVPNAKFFKIYSEVAEKAGALVNGPNALPAPAIIAKF